MHRLLRIIDVNLNRSQEGLRVCEDIVRFVLNDRKMVRSFKSLRHKLGALAKRIYRKSSFLKSRNVKRDVGKLTTYREGKRKNIGDVFRANIQRVKESLRVLEETSKLLDRRISQSFKTIRFRVYELEKKSRIKLETILHHR
ncbi:MAG: thiamine-phosphate pyrophosphorylase [Candidatus Omnitrophota bacterium]|nr:MAG: thiamine-phosphate pyrophosphorylase [Candidatus Omnitrophota bacterium]